MNYVIAWIAAYIVICIIFPYSPSTEDTWLQNVADIYIYVFIVLRQGERIRAQPTHHTIQQHQPTFKERVKTSKQKTSSKVLYSKIQRSTKTIGLIEPWTLPTSLKKRYFNDSLSLWLSRLGFARWLRSEGGEDAVFPTGAQSKSRPLGLLGPTTCWKVALKKKKTLKKKKQTCLKNQLLHIFKHEEL